MSENKTLFFALVMLLLGILPATETKILAETSGAGNRSGNNNLVVGFRGGINFSTPAILGHVNVIQRPDGSSLFEKDYLPLFRNLGYQYAFMAMYYIRPGMSLAFEPGMSSFNYRYNTQTGWNNGASTSDYIEYTADHMNTINYIELPLIFRKEFERTGLTPFLSIGLFYGFMISGSKKVLSEVTRHTGSASIPFESSTTLADNSQSYIHSRFGVAPGAGFFYPVGPVKLMLAVDFGFGFNNIVRESDRFNNAGTTAGFYDVQDDMRLGTLNVHIGILFNTGSKQAGKAVECITLKRRKKP